MVHFLHISFIVVEKIKGVERLESWIVHEVLKNAADKFRDKPFIYGDGEMISFQQLDEKSDLLAQALLDEGFQKGDTIAILALNQIEWLYTYFAAAKIGVAVVALNVRYRDKELEYMLNHSKAKGIVAISQYGDFNFVSFFAKYRKRIPDVQTFIFIGKGFEGSLNFQQLLAYRPIDSVRLSKMKQLVKDMDPVLIIYTSGTTGTPKGTMITNRSILASAKAQIEHLRIDEHDSAIGSLPFNHVGGITCTVHCGLLSGSSIVLIREFHPESVLQAIDEKKPTIFGGVPTMYLMLLNNKNLKKYDLSSLRICIVGGSNVDPHLCQFIKTHIPTSKIINLYGLSESSGACILSRLSDSLEKVQYSLGVPIGDFKAKIVDHEKNDLPIGEVGELAIQGSCIAQGYLGLPKETKETFSDDGWLYTGDIAYMDHEGYVVYKGRKKEMYIQGGYNVYPVEVENLLMSHPKIEMAAGIGVPDPFLGEVGRYYIVPKKGQSLTEEEVIHFCYKHLADYKVPKQIIFVNELPQTPAGKIKKTILKEQFLKEVKSKIE